MLNYWLSLAGQIVEKEVLLVKSSPDAKIWFDQMPTILSVIVPATKQPNRIDEFGPKVGIAHHIRYTRLGIEGVMKMPKKYFRYSYYVLKDKFVHPLEHFWVVLFK